MTKLYKRSILNLIYLLPMAIVFIIFGLILSFISNIGFNPVDSDYVVGGFYLSYYNPVIQKATSSIVQFSLFSSFFIFSLSAILLAVLCRLLEAYIKSKAKKNEEVLL
ncbi:hypothetical protein CMV25_07370 [Lactococcus raffinolactis]|nr:hypothetical protein CMV25_07370 [Lactococcus raffinolactis]